MTGKEKGISDSLISLVNLMGYRQAHIDHIIWSVKRKQGLLRDGSSGQPEPELSGGDQLTRNGQNAGDCSAGYWNEEAEAGPVTADAEVTLSVRDGEYGDEVAASDGEVAASDDEASAREGDYVDEAIANVATPVELQRQQHVDDCGAIVAGYWDESVIEKVG